MKLTNLLAVGVLASVALVQSASAAIFADNFNSYANDTDLLAVWSRVTGTVGSIYLSPDPATGGTFGQGIQNTTATGRLRHVLDTPVTPTDSNPISLSFDLYDSNGGATSGRGYVELRNSAAVTGLFAAGVYNSVNTGTLDTTKYQARNLDSGGWIQLEAARSVGWHHFEFVIKGTTADLYVDGLLDPNFTGRTYSGGVAYDWVHVGSALTSLMTTINYDNVSLSVVPEPSVATLALVGIGLAVWRRRQT
jgi:hypothetical protein